jgi:hypothetical protein
MTQIARTRRSGDLLAVKRNRSASIIWIKPQSAVTIDPPCTNQGELRVAPAGFALRENARTQLDETLIGFYVKRTGRRAEHPDGILGVPIFRWFVFYCDKLL